MKKILIAACACALMLTMAGCGNNNSSSSSSSSSASSASTSSSSSASTTSSSSSSNASASASGSSSTSPAAGSTSSSSTESQFVEWFNATSGETAAQGAGIDKFVAPDTIVTNGNPVSAPLYSYLKGISQATYEGGAYEIIIRKADKSIGTRIPGDAFDFKYEWKIDSYGVEVSCYGHAENQPTLIEWNNGNHAFSALYLGLGGDVMVFSDNDIATIVQTVS